MTDTLSDFLLARIAEDEAGAHAATSGPWRWESVPGDFQDEDMPGSRFNEWGHRGPDLLAGDDEGVISSTGYDADNVIVKRADAEHIARHDPARVLADCAAKRHTIQACTYWLGEDNADARSLAVAVLTSLASAHTAHPGFNPVWLETV